MEASYKKMRKYLSQPNDNNNTTNANNSSNIGRDTPMTPRNVAEPHTPTGRESHNNHITSSSLTSNQKKEFEAKLERSINSNNNKSTIASEEKENTNTSNKLSLLQINTETDEIDDNDNPPPTKDMEDNNMTNESNNDSNNDDMNAKVSTTGLNSIISELRQKLKK